MTVSAQTPINRSTGNGVTTVFPYTFKIISDGDIEVSVDDVVKTLNVDYTVSGAGLDAGGDVTMTTAPAVGTAVVRRRDMAIVRSTDYQDQGTLPAATLDLDIDSTVLMMQQLDERMGRTFSLPASSAADGTMPAPVGGYVLGWDALGKNLTNLPASAGTSLIDLAASSGSSLVGFIQSGTGSVSSTVQAKLRESVSVKDFGAVGDGVTDDTAAIQAAITAHSRVYLPPGVYLVDAVVGLVVRTGTQIVGAGKNKSIIVAKAGGGTLVELENYNRGSLIRRQFNVSPGTNAYVNEVYLADFAVVLTHPTGSVTTTQIQIGIDLRNITRSIVERVHVGNIAPLGGAYSKATNGAYDVQGYGIVVGNVSSGEASYAGGEVNTIRDCSAWGAYKLIVQDDGTLSPLSSAHATTVQNCDLQGGHHVLVQESQYATGNAWRDNVLQNILKQPGDVSNAFIARCEGYNNEMSGGYIEAGSAANYLLHLGGSSKNNHFRLSHYSATNGALITDAGTKNELEYFENSGAIVGGVDSFGAPVRLYNRAYRRAWVKFHWDGSAIVIDGGQGATVTRNNPGDYTVTWVKAFSSDDYAISVLLDTNASGHGGTFSVGSHTSSNLRINTYGQNAGTTSIIDPRFVWVRAEQ